MEFSPVIQEFTLNVNRVTQLCEEEQRIGIEWIEKFEESDEALKTCCEILNTTLEENVKHFAVKIVQNKIKKTSNYLNEDFALKMYRIFINLLKLFPNPEMTKQICIALVILFTRTKIWTISLQQIFDDILSIVPQHSKLEGDQFEESFSKKTALFFTRELCFEYMESTDSNIEAMRSKRIPEIKTVIDETIGDLIKTLKDDPLLKETIDLCSAIEFIISPKNNFADENILLKWNALKNVDSGNIQLINSYGDCITEYIKELQMKSTDETENYYHFFACLVKDLKPHIVTRIQKNPEHWVVIITRIVTTLAIKFFEVFINSNYEDEFSYYDALNFLGEFNNIRIYNEITKFWIKLENHLVLYDSVKFKNFIDKFCRLFAIQSFKALFLLEPVVNECQNDPNDTFVIDVRTNMLRCLITVFRFIPMQPNLNDFVSVIKTGSCDISQLKLNIDSHYPVDFGGVVEMILNIPPDALLVLIEKCCKSLHDLFDFWNHLETVPEVAKIALDLIYKWLAQVPGPASKIVEKRSRYRIDYLDSLTSDADYMHNIVVNSRDLSVVKSIAEMTGKVIRGYGYDWYFAAIFERLVKFYERVLLQDFTNNSNESDSARLALFTMTAFSKIFDGIYWMCVYNDSLPLAEKAIPLCMTVIYRFKNNVEIRDITLNVLSSILHKTFHLPYDHEKVFEQLLQIDPFSDLVCNLERFLYFINASDGCCCGTDWFFKRCLVIFQKACDFLSREESDPPNLIQILLKIIQPMFKENYEEFLEFKDIGMLITEACRGLSPESGSSFNDCYSVIKELFLHYYSPYCKNPTNNNSMALSLFDSHFHQIVKSCMENILTHNDNERVSSSGFILYLMNNAKEHGINSCLKIDGEMVHEIVEKHFKNICSCEFVFCKLMKILSASNSSEAGFRASKLNKKLKSS